MSQKSDEGETTYTHYLHALLSEKERKEREREREREREKKGPPPPPAFDLIKINEPCHAARIYFF